MTETQHLLDAINRAPKEWHFTVARVRITKAMFAKLQTETCPGAHWSFDDDEIKLNDVVVEVWPDA